MLEFAIWLVLIAGICCYIVSYGRAKSGRMIVYQDWVDFILSSLWLTLASCGWLCRHVIAQMEKDCALTYEVVGEVLMFAGFLSFIWLVNSAVKANRGNWVNCALAIGTKIIVSIAIVLAIEKLRQSLARGQGKLASTTMIPLMIVGVLFAVFIKPLIASRSQVDDGWLADELRLR